MGIFDGWKKYLSERKEDNKFEDTPEIKKLKEPIKVSTNERGKVESEQFLKNMSGLTEYARNSNYLGTDSKQYKDDTTRRYQSGFHSGSGSKAPNLNRGMGVGPTQKISAPHKSFHSEQLGAMGKLGCSKPLGMGPIGMEDNSAVNSNQQNKTGSSQPASSKLTRPF